MVVGLNYTIVTAYVGTMTNPQNVISYVKACLGFVSPCTRFFFRVLFSHFSLCAPAADGSATCSERGLVTVSACPGGTQPQVELIRDKWSWFDMTRPNDPQPFLLRTRVQFAQQPQAGAQGVKPPMPPIFPSLPEDIFYPFLVDSGAAGARGGAGGAAWVAAVAAAAAAALALLA